MISIDRVQKCIVLSRFETIHEGKQTLTVGWIQRVDTKGVLRGTGRFRVRGYIGCKGEGMRARILAIAKRKKEIDKISKSKEKESC